jgi:hypothetical protein
MGFTSQNWAVPHIVTIHLSFCYLDDSLVTGFSSRYKADFAIAARREEKMGDRGFWKSGDGEDKSSPSRSHCI